MAHIYLMNDLLEMSDCDQMDACRTRFACTFAVAMASDSKAWKRKGEEIRKS